MAMKICKDCGTEISKSAKTCPKCGKKLKHTGVRVVLGLAIIMIGICAITSSNTNTTNTENAKPVSAQVQEEKMTLEKFNKIETGMTYQQVVDIVGEEGTLSTESSYGDQTMKIYYWYAKNGISNATISFMNGKVTAKSQIGLN